MLHATRLTGGENSDSVIMNGSADVKLVDSEYDISLTSQAVGGTARYALPINQPLNTIIDSTKVPGAAYRLELINTKVSLWFLFVGGVSMDGPATTVLLEDCPCIILSVMGGNLQGHWHLPAVLQPALLDRDVTAGVNGLLNNPAAGFYVVAEQERVVRGALMVTFEWSDWRNKYFWWIQSVYVTPSHRRRGIFSQLLREVVTMAVERSDVSGLRLYVREDNQIAQATYKSLGMDQTHYDLYEVQFSFG